MCSRSGDHELGQRRELEVRQDQPDDPGHDGEHEQGPEPASNVHRRQDARGHAQGIEQRHSDREIPHDAEEEGNDADRAATVDRAGCMRPEDEDTGDHPQQEEQPYAERSRDADRSAAVHLHRHGNGCGHEGEAGNPERPPEGIPRSRAFNGQAGPSRRTSQDVRGSSSRTTGRESTKVMPSRPPRTGPRAVQESQTNPTVCRRSAPGARRACRSQA